MHFNLLPLSYYTQKKTGLFLGVFFYETNLFFPEITQYRYRITISKLHNVLNN